MKRILLSTLLLLLAVYSCKKKEYDCFFPFYYLRGCKLAFEGYLPQEVDSIRWFSYKAGTHFSEPPIDSQWVYTDSFKVDGQQMYKSTAIDSAASFVELKLGLDYRIITPLKIHTITDIQVGDSGYYYTRETPCGGGRFSVRPFDSLTVDGIKVAPTGKWNLQYYAWLQKP